LTNINQFEEFSSLVSTTLVAVPLKYLACHSEKLLVDPSLSHDTGEPIKGPNLVLTAIVSLAKTPIIV
ncbi:unnamed protein product, partial [Lymnaea stagnalis]